MATPDIRPDDHAADLVAAYGGLQAAVLMAGDVVEFLDEISTLAASLVPGASCGITMDQYPQTATVASSDDFALSLDEIQYGYGQGPCLEAMATNVEMAIADLDADERWPDYRVRALATGVRSSLSIPVSMSPAQTQALGALNLYSRDSRRFSDTELGNLRGFARAAAIALTLVLRHTVQNSREAQLREALATRAVIDQALGILMGQHRITSHDAWEMLRNLSSTTNRKLGDIAAELIQATTGAPPIPGRPFIEPR